MLCAGGCSLLKGADIVDNDVLQIAEKLGISPQRLYTASNNIKPRNRRDGSKYENYHTVVIHRGRGRKNRVLSVPNGFLKMVQRRILDKYLYNLDVSVFSTAYRKGSSLLGNAAPHVGKECILKLDISHFFDSINDDMVYLAFKRLGLSVPATTLLAHICTYKCSLPQGAPTSPYIANLVMKQFDERLGKWCGERGIAYTRYCDDMTFSGDRSAMRNSHIICKVKLMLYRMGFELNAKKTVFVSSSQQQRVTGIVVNDKPALSREQRRTIRQEVYYCTKFGTAESLQHCGLDIAPDVYLRSLLGRISFALQIEPDCSEMQSYFETVKKLYNDECRQ